MSEEKSGKSASSSSSSTVVIGSSSSSSRRRDRDSITSIPLNGNNYAIWSRAVKIYYMGERKFCYLTDDPPAKEATNYSDWEAENCHILVELWNSMEPQISAPLFYLDTAKQVWNRLAGMYSGVNNLRRTYDLHHQFFSLSIGSGSLEDYYSKFRGTCEELRVYEPISSDPQVMERQRERLEVARFLYGLSSFYDPVRSQILGERELPSLDEVFRRLRQASMSDASSVSQPPPVSRVSHIAYLSHVDDFDLFKERILGSGDKQPHPHKKALLFVDNSGADVVLGMLPLARELLRRGTEVVLVANSLPALNDVTAMELPDIVAEAAKHCDILRRAAEAGGILVDAMINTTDVNKEKSFSVPLMVVENGCGSPCIDLRHVSSELVSAAKNADLVILEGMGRALHTNYDARFKCDALKLAMVKNQRLAEKLINGNIYDCVCRYEPSNSKLQSSSLC